MSPTVFREKGYRFFFFSREETRMHVHVISGDGEAKYWLEPEIELSKQSKYSNKQLSEIKSLVENTKMKSSQLGKNTSEIEVTNISGHGIWFYANGTEHFLSLIHI